MVGFFYSWDRISFYFDWERFTLFIPPCREKCRAGFWSRYEKVSAGEPVVESIEVSVDLKADGIDGRAGPEDGTIIRICDQPGTSC